MSSNKADKELCFVPKTHKTTIQQVRKIYGRESTATSNYVISQRESRQSRLKGDVHQGSYSNYLTSKNKPKISSNYPTPLNRSKLNSLRMYMGADRSRRD